MTSFEKPTKKEVKAPKKESEIEYLSGKILVAMPTMGDPRFTHAVIYMCAHGPEGAMGVVLNRMFGEINFRSLLDQLEIPILTEAEKDIPVHLGGPVETARGFVLHSMDYKEAGAKPVTDKIALSATIEILEAIAHGNGPNQVLLALGYAGWGAGQLEKELQQNTWLSLPEDEEIIFKTPMDKKWNAILEKNGISPIMLSADMGHA